MDRAADPIGKREGDTPEPQPEEPRLRLPWMTVLLTAGLVGAAYGQYLLGGARVRPGGELTGAAIHWLLGAKVNSLIAEGELWRLVTANFLHGSFTHLAWNVFCLLCLGWLVESLYRPTRFLALFLAGGIVGTLASYLVNHEVSLGASAGGMGLLGALLVHNLRYRKELPRRWIRMYPYLLILLGVQLGLDQILQNVDAAGHLGGLVGGAGMALLFESQAVAAAAERKDRFPAPAALAASLLLLAYGGAGVWQFGRSNPEMRSAGQVRSSWSRIRALARVLERRPRMVEARLSRAMLLFTLSNGDEGLVEFQRALRDRPSLARGRGHSRLRNQILEFHELRGFQKFGIQDWDAVLESTLYVIRNAPSPRQKAEAYNQYAWILADKQKTRLDEAEQYSRESLRLLPDTPSFLDTLAWIFYQRGKYQEAYQQQAQAIAAANDRGMAGSEQMSDLYFHLGAIEEKLTRVTESRASYARALQTRPGYTEAVEGLRRLSGIVAPPDPLDPQPGQDPAVSRGVL